MQTKQEKQQKAANKLYAELLEENEKREALQARVSYTVWKSKRQTMLECQLSDLKMKGITPIN